MKHSECAICYENLGKIHRVLQCGHKFHHKCIKACENTNTTIHQCPYCRQDYENICLRNRNILNKEEKKKKTEFVSYIKKYLKDCETTSGKREKFLICNIIFKRISEEINILSKSKFGFSIMFINVVKNKLIELDPEINELKTNNKITSSEHNKYFNYRKIIFKNL